MGVVSPKLFLTWVLHKCSNLMGYGNDGVGRVGTGNYSVPPMRMEARPTKYLEQAKRQLLAHYSAKAERPHSTAFCLSVERNRDAFERIPADSIDYVFTDPPYLNIEVQYGEMNFLWDAWLGFPSSLCKEITFNPIQKHSWEEAENELRRAVSAMFTVLKPGRCLSICYHDTSEANWTMLQNALLDAGFEINSVTCLDPRSKSRKAITAEKIVKSDLVLNCRKPMYADEARPSEEATGTSNRVRDILVENLGRISGQSRDKLWDIVLKRLLARGQMAEHRFQDILSEVAYASESGRWFLKEEYESLSQNDVQNEEEAGVALERFARLRMKGVPVQLAAQIALQRPALGNSDADEDEIERYIATHFIDDPAAKRKFKLGGVSRASSFTIACSSISLVF